MTLRNYRIQESARKIMNLRLLPEEIEVMGKREGSRIPFASNVVRERRCTVLRDDVLLDVKQMV